MSNVAKLKKKAAEFELKRQFDKALAIYIELLDNFDSNADELDVALFNRVGDMLLRQGNVADAVDYYERAVDKYAESGFFNNAIALCNKILRQSPGRTSVYYKLGKISAQKGFKSDAKQNFLEYADRMQKAGRMDEAFRALKEFADLCPDQDDIRLMLADQLTRQARSGEAIEQLQTLFDRYTSDGRDTEARATLDRIRAIDPAYEPRVTGQQAAQKSSDLVFLDVYATSEPPSRRTPDDPLAGLPIQRFDEAPPPAPAARPIAAPIPEPEPEPVQPEPAMPPATAAPEMLGFESTGLDGAGATSGGLLDLEPTSFGGGAAEPVGIPPQRSTLDGLETTSFEPSAGALDFDQPFLPVDAEPAAAESVTPEPLDLPAVDPAAPEVVQPGTEASVPEVFVEPATFEDLPLMDLEIPSAPTMPLRPTGDIPSISAGDVGVDQRQAFADAWAAGESSEIGFPMRSGFDLAGNAAVDDLTVGLDDTPGLEPMLDVVVDRTRSATIAAEQSVERLEAEALAHPDDLVLRRQLAEARLESGDRDGGLADLEACMAALEQVEDLAGAASLADEIARITPDSVRIQQKRVEYAFRTSDRSRLVGAYLDLATALLGDGQSEKARTVYKRVLDLAPDDIAAQAGLAALSAAVEEPAAPARPVAPSRPTPVQATGASAKSARRDEVRAAPPKPVPTASAGDDAFVNLGDWLRDDEAPRSTRMVVDEKEPSGDEEADFAEMLRKFKQGVAENVDAEDHQSHYDLGVAFKEMGLVDEAIAEFQKALRAPTNRLPTYEALGQCFVEKGQHQVATAILSRALAEQNAADEQLIGVLYLLGVAAETLGKPQEALDFYQRVFVIDIQFRDVSDRLSAVEQAGR